MSRKWYLVLVIVLAAFSALLLVWELTEVGRLYVEDGGNKQTWRFEEAGISLVTTIENRQDSLIDWDQNVYCNDGHQEIWTFAIGYDTDAYVRRHQIVRAVLVPRLNGILYTTTDGGTYFRPTGCSD